MPLPEPLPADPAQNHVLPRAVLANRTKRREPLGLSPGCGARGPSAPTKPTPTPRPGVPQAF